jgi:hypothetical protein
LYLRTFDRANDDWRRNVEEVHAVVNCVKNLKTIPMMMMMERGDGIQECFMKYDGGVLFSDLSEKPECYIPIPVGRVNR